ncbi:MAG: ATP-binding protein [bacterium]
MNDKDKLRGLAEARFAQAPKTQAPQSAEEIRQAFHELQVHQIELEMQNEELHQAFADLTVERARYFDLYDLAPMGYITIGENGLIQNANLAVASLFGVARGRLINRSLFHYIFEGDHDNYYLHHKKILATTAPQDFELRVLKHDGTAFWAHLTESFAQGSDGACLVRIALSDITGRKQLEADKDRLEIQNRQLQKNESLGRMAGAIAHSFNNHLMAVMGNLELALEEVPRNKELFETLSSSLHAAGQAADISRSMVTYLGQTQTDSVLTDLSEICRQSLPLLNAVMPRSVELKLNLPDPGPAISADVRQMQKVIINLVANAWESYVAPSGIVRLSVKTVLPAEMPVACWVPNGWQPQKHAYACLEVEDSGCGIESKDLDKIFDPFFTTKFAGRGMGLALVMGIVQTHHGGLTVESKPGRGCIVRAYFPLAEEVVLTTPGQPAPVSQAEAGGLILLIEDDESVRQVAARMIEHSGFTVLTAGDGVEGLEVFRQHIPDVRCVVCDLTMPRMGGWETLAALRVLSPGLPVILASGYDESAVMAGDHPEKPQAFLSKPYQLHALRGVIGKAVKEIVKPSLGI